jgi:hypothetical protein
MSVFTVFDIPMSLPARSRNHPRPVDFRPRQAEKCMTSCIPLPGQVRADNRRPAGPPCRGMHRRAMAIRPAAAPGWRAMTCSRRGVDASGGAEPALAYRQFVTAGLVDPPHAPWSAARHGWILGSAAFAEPLRRQVGQSPPRGRAPRGPRGPAPLRQAGRDGMTRAGHVLPPLAAAPLAR